MGRRPRQTLFQRRHKDSEKAHEKMLNIANYQSNANQTYNEVSPYTGQNGHYRKATNNILERVWRTMNPPTILVGMQIGTAIGEHKSFLDKLKM